NLAHSDKRQSHRRLAVRADLACDYQQLQFVAGVTDLHVPARTELAAYAHNDSVVVDIQHLYAKAQNHCATESVLDCAENGFEMRCVEGLSGGEYDFFEGRAFGRSGFENNRLHPRDLHHAD